MDTIFEINHIPATDPLLIENTQGTCCGPDEMAVYDFARLDGLSAKVDKLNCTGIVCRGGECADLVEHMLIERGWKFERTDNVDDVVKYHDGSYGR